MIRERIEYELDSNSQLRQYIRKLGKCVRRNYPIKLIDGDDPPKLKGTRGYRVPVKEFPRSDAPLAFTMQARGGYWRRSSRCIEVGSDWLLETLLTCRYRKVNNGEEKESRTA